MWISREEYERLSNSARIYREVNERISAVNRNNFEQSYRHINEMDALANKYGQIVKDKDAEIEKLKAMVPRKTLLATLPIEEIKKVAQNLNILIQDGEDIADIIESILDTEARLEKLKGVTR
jgi:hypothetical protein